MATNLLEPNLLIPQPMPQPPLDILTGKLDATIVDSTNLAPEVVLNRQVANGINIGWKLTGLMAPNYHNADNFRLTAYLEEASNGTDQVVTGAIFQGSTGTLSGGGFNARLEFPAAVFPNPPTLLIPANSIPAGVYRVTVVLSHQPAGTNPRVAGFVDLGMVEFYNP